MESYGWKFQTLIVMLKVQYCHTYPNDDGYRDQQLLSGTIKDSNTRTSSNSGCHG